MVTSDFLHLLSTCPQQQKFHHVFFTDLNNIYIYTYRYIYFVELLLSARIRYFWLPQELPSHFWFFQPKTLHHLADDCTRTPSIWNLWCSKAFIRNLFDSLCSSFFFFFSYSLIFFTMWKLVRYSYGGLPTFQNDLDVCLSLVAFFFFFVFFCPCSGA